MAEQYKVLHPVKYYRHYLDNKIRPDGREFANYRPIVVNLGSIKTADGSAIAKIGKTTVICGIKAELCQPKAETPDEGYFVPNLELSPLCSSKFRPGPPSEQAQVYTQIIADIVKDSKCLDLKTLCLHPDKLAWCLYADMICLDFDGAVIDASIIALMAALKSVTLPSVEYDPALDNKLVNLDDRRPLIMENLPYCTTFLIFDEHILIDPTVEEEDLGIGQVIIAVKNDEVCFVLKPGGTPLDQDQLSKCISDGIKRAKVIEKLVTTTVSS